MKTMTDREYKESLLKAVRDRIGRPSTSKQKLAVMIKKRFGDAAPKKHGKLIYELFEWFLQQPFDGQSLVGIPRLQNAKRTARRRPDLREGDDFLSSYEWRRLRMQVIKERGRRCECCGASPADGKTVINVDHIKPRKLFPALALEKSNLQVLCDACNHGKGNWDQTDWRADPPPANAVIDVPSLHDAMRDQEQVNAIRFDATPRLVREPANPLRFKFRTK